MSAALVWERLEPFGALIACDLSRSMAPEQEQALKDLLDRHGLLLARGQSLTMERQRSLCALFGPILDRAGEGGVMSNEAGGYAASALNWHSDAAYTPDPFDALSLHALDVEPDASSTLFVDARAALDRLPADLRAALEGRLQDMIAPHYTRLDRITCESPDPEALKHGTMPAIMAHPRTGEAVLWVNAMQTARLHGMDWRASRDILLEVFRHLYAPEYVLRHDWRKGDIVIWDNVSLQHSRGNVEQVGRRVLQRVIVGRAGVAPHVETA